MYAICVDRGTSVFSAIVETLLQLQHNPQYIHHIETLEDSESQLQVIASVILPSLLEVMLSLESIRLCLVNNIIQNPQYIHYYLSNFFQD